MIARKFSVRKERSEKRRSLGALVFLFLCFCGLFIRIFTLQVILGESMRRRAEMQGRLNLELLPWRGTIYDRQLRELAISVATDSLYLRPGSVRDPDEVKSELSGVLQLEGESVEEKLSSGRPFVWVKRQVEKHRAEALRLLPGLGKIEESSRFYPNEFLASHVIGFAGVDNYGLEGIELFYDRYLSGIPGALNSRRDARGRETAAFRQRRVEPDEGHSLVLTIDKIVQLIVEEELDRYFTSADDDTGRIKIKGASAVVMEPSTGRILALANRPAFSPVDAGAFPADSRRNRAVTDVFEPGSSFKIIAAAAALEEGVFSPEDRIYCEKGAYRVAGHTIRDVSPSEELTFEEIIMKSSNIGMVKIGREVGNSLLFEYARRFGFGRKTGCDLPGEAGGILRHPRSWSGLSNASMSFGYEVGVTAIQLAAAYSAVANGGVLMRPSVVSAVVNGAGAVEAEFEPEEVRRVISRETASKLTRMLVRAVEEGTGTRAKLPGYSTAGKTGTARKLGEDGTYSRTGYVSSFAGFAPAGSPEFVAVVVVDEPQVPSHQAYGGSMAAPVFKNMASRILRYLGTPPEGAESAAVPGGAPRVSVPSPAPAKLSSGFAERGGHVVYVGGDGSSGIMMPDLRGLSMRDALRALSPLGLEVEFHGSGSAVRQNPAPGSEIAPGSKCVVIFSSG